MIQKKEIPLKVMEALQEEAYKGIVRIDSETMHHIDVRPGDIVEIEGSRTTVGIVGRAYPTDVGQTVIRMDGILRRNAKASIGEIVKVRKADVKEAKMVSIAPAQEGMMIQVSPEIIKQGILGRAVIKGDIITLGGARGRKRTMSDSPFFEDIFNVFEEGFIGNFSLGSIKFVVVETNPKQPVIVTETTQVIVNAKAVQVTEEKVPEVTYEDLGGLEEEIKKIREMVELPLKHPEIFNRLGIEPPSGVLLHGPPGSGKTLLAKAVANESEANFMLVNGPEVMNKFYGECVAEDSLVITNGAGLTTIKEAVENNQSHKIAAINMQAQKTQLLPISDVYDKGMQDTLQIHTPHTMLELTPTSKLLVLDGLDVSWIFAKDLKIGDRVAVANTLPKITETLPNILDFVDDNTKFSGDWVRELFNSNGNNKEVSTMLSITTKKVQDHKYNGSASALFIRKLYKQDFADSLKLTGKGKIPTKITKDLTYLLGLLSGDGHLRYNYKDKAVSTISLTNADKNIINGFNKIIKKEFGLEVKKRQTYEYYFSSRPIGNLLKNLGIPIKNKAKTLRVPSYLISMPKDFIASYLRGLFDTDGHVHLVTSGMQISYYTSSKQMMIGVKYLLLRLNIQSTFRYKSDGTYELTISDSNSLQRFKHKIGFNHTKRKERLDLLTKNRYSKPVYNRIHIQDTVKKIKSKHNITDRQLIGLGLNHNVNSYTRDQMGVFISLLKNLNEDSSLIDKIETLKNNDIIWSPIKVIQKSQSQVYDFTVPNHHNFIANGFIVHNSEKRIRDLFEEAEQKAPSIIFIDEIDAIAPKREETRGEVERRVVAQLLTMMSGLKSRKNIVVIGATNRPNAIDPALRRPGRFDREISIGVPSKEGRLDILKIHTRNMPLTEDVKLQRLAEVTHGFVGADLAILCKEAAMNVLRRLLPNINLKEKEPIPKEVLEKLRVTDADFRTALKIVRPSALREVLVETPNIKWSDVGGLTALKEELKEAVEWPLKHQEAFKRLGIRPPKGILIYGPPGTGKTLIAKAIATESEANFIHIKGPSLLNLWVGESERGLRKIFEKARQVAPSIIFFDEIDSIAPKRGRTFGDKVTERMVTTLLAEMDGLDSLNDVLVIAATNRPDMLDPALLRPGRFDKIISTRIPDKKTRLEIFKIHTSKMPLAKDVSLEKISELTENYVGADIEAVCREAGILSLREDIKSKEVKLKHFQYALKIVKPSISPDDLKAYTDIEEEYIRKAKANQVKPETPSYLG